jgi:hypothetical protein
VGLGNFVVAKFLVCWHFTMCWFLEARYHVWRGIECRITNEELSGHKVVLLLQANGLIHPDKIVMHITRPTNNYIHYPSKIVTCYKAIDPIKSLSCEVIFTIDYRCGFKWEQCSINNTNTVGDIKLLPDPLSNVNPFFRGRPAYISASQLQNCSNSSSYIIWDIPLPQSKIP